MPEVAGTQSVELPRLLRAARREVLDRPTVWLMRQAGRYMPEYQAIRQKVSILELCKHPDLAVEASLLPLQLLGVDGVIMFSDILIPAEAMGMHLEFTEKGPVMHNPVRSAAAIEKLSIPDPVEKTGFVMDILSKLRQELVAYPDVALIGFAGAPWTMATYMIEGGTVRNYTEIKRMMYNDPALLHKLLDKLAQTITQYLNAQIEAGAQIVQLFDTWAGILPEAQYKTFAFPYQKKVIDGLNRDKAAVILYVKGSNPILELMPVTGADIVSLDELTTITRARQRLGLEVVLQGNLDNNALFAKPQVLKTMVQAMVQEGGNQGYIFNLGHGILPTTPVENVKLLVDTVKESSLTLSSVT